MDPQQQMLRITGYSDRFSVTPGEEVTFYVHCEHNESYQADIVRLIHGDTNPAGPGYKEELINTPVSAIYSGKSQPIYAGSYIFVPHGKVLDLSSFTICAFIYPTTPAFDVEVTEVGAQGILTKWLVEEETGYGLFINEKGELALRIGRGVGRFEEFSTGQRLFRKVWYKVWASYDAGTGRVRVVQKPYLTNTNGGHGMSMLHPLYDTAGDFDGSSHLGGALANVAPFLMAASTLKVASGRYVGAGGHFKGVPTPVEIPIHGQKYIG
jgi:N,N-dimethylformamidase